MRLRMMESTSGQPRGMLVFRKLTMVHSSALENPEILPRLLFHSSYQTPVVPIILKEMVKQKGLFRQWQISKRSPLTLTLPFSTTVQLHFYNTHTHTHTTESASWSGPKSSPKTTKIKNSTETWPFGTASWSGPKSSPKTTKIKNSTETWPFGTASWSGPKSSPKTTKIKNSTETWPFGTLLS